MLHMLEPPIQHTPDINLHQMPILRMCLPLTQLLLSCLGIKVNFENMLSGAKYRQKGFTYIHYHIQNIGFTA